MDINEIREDIAAFADDEQGVIVEKNKILFSRDRRTYVCSVSMAAGEVIVECDGIRLPYRKFISEELGRMSVLAQAVSEKTPNVLPYIDTIGELDSQEGGLQIDSASNLLEQCCTQKPFNQSKLVFLTADAGEGKTALLRHMTKQVAAAYTNGKSPWLLLHVDIQGRQLLRLEEAIAGLLGRLRVSGLFYSGVVRLARHDLIVLAIDGFDELLAETGSGEAFSALGAVLRQLQGKGIVLAASRTAFFEAENYLAQSNLLARLHDSQCTFEKLRLKKWSRDQTVAYFRGFELTGQKVSGPEDTYKQLADSLGPDHPVLTRPFLVDRITRTLIGTKEQAPTLASEIGSQQQVVPSVIRAFLKREVEDKWLDRTGQPYLTLDQHVQFLAMIAEEMWVQGDDSLPLEIVQITAQLLVEHLGIPESRRATVVDMAKAHVLLTSSASGRENYRAFDHEEFLNYFLAVRCRQLLRVNETTLQRFLERHVVPRWSIRWIAWDDAWDSNTISEIMQRLCQMAASQVRSTALRQNCGAICAELLKLSASPVNLSLDSLYFEGIDWSGVTLRAIKFTACTFLDVDWSSANLQSCLFEKSTITNATYNDKTNLKGTKFGHDSTITGLRDRGQPDELRDYLESRCKQTLTHLGATFTAPTGPSSTVTVPPDPPRLHKRRKVFAAFLRLFDRNSGATEELIRVRLGSRASTFNSEVLPALLGLGMLEETVYRGHSDQKRYVLNYSVDDILRAEDPRSRLPQPLKDFWRRMES